MVVYTVDNGIVAGATTGVVKRNATGVATRVATGVVTGNATGVATGVITGFVVRVGMVEVITRFVTYVGTAVDVKTADEADEEACSDRDKV